MCIHQGCIFGVDQGLVSTILHALFASLELSKHTPCCLCLPSASIYVHEFIWKHGDGFSHLTCQNASPVCHHNEDFLSAYWDVCCAWSSETSISSSHSWQRWTISKAIEAGSRWDPSRASLPLLGPMVAASPTSWMPFPLCWGCAPLRCGASSPRTAWQGLLSVAPIQPAYSDTSFKHKILHVVLQQE